MKLEAKNIYGASYNWNFPLGAQQENVGDPKQSEEIHQGLTICDSIITKFGQIGPKRQIVLTWAPAKNKKIKIAIAIVCKRLLIGVLKTDA